MPTAEAAFVSVAAATMLAFLVWLSLEMAITDAKQQTLLLIAGATVAAMGAAAAAVSLPRRR